jgi:hypothetical protein
MWPTLLSCNRKVQLVEPIQLQEHNFDKNCRYLMKLFPQDSDVVLYETGFEDDFLGRQQLSKQLSELVERIESPMVIALDDSWGAGKSYFLKRWVGAHQRENDGTALTVYFDAFENDYLSEPLVSLITAVNERVSDKEQPTIEKWKAVATKLAKPTFGVALSLATFGAKQHLDEIGDVLVEAISAEAKDAAYDLWDVEQERRSAMISFKNLLIQLTEDGTVPIVIVIDELDRCRPDYALLVLEVIKHFFSVPKVHFILGVNGKALENSVKARYGGEIDAESYLRKFINLSFSLPRVLGPQGDERVQRLYARQLAADMSLPAKLSERCANLLSYVAEQNDVSLRDVGKVFSKMALLPKEAISEKKCEGWTDILCVILVSSVIAPKLHRRIVEANASMAEIREFLGASEIKTTAQIDGIHNREFEYDLSIWFWEVLYVCGFNTVDASRTQPDLETLESQVGSRFKSFGMQLVPQDIPAQIQKDWVEIFRIK